jgi:hypothetical protein
MQDSLEKAGLKDITISPAQVSEKGKAEYGEDFWKEYESNPDQVSLCARKY